MESVLILGVDSLIGQALKADLELHGNLVWGTTRRKDKIGTRVSYLDLARDKLEWCIPDHPFSVAVICFGVTSMRDCELDYENSSRVNVDATSILFNILVGRGIFVIFLSSDQVYAGNIPFVLPMQKAMPVTKYGLLKSMTEDRILSLGNQVSVVRFTKIVTPNMQLIKYWKGELLNHRQVSPYSNVVMNPVPLWFSIEVLIRVIEKKISGIVQVSGVLDISYDKVAYYLAYLMDVDYGLIKSIQCKNPRIYSTLDIGRLRQELKMEPPTLLEALNYCLSAEY